MNEQFYKVLHKSGIDSIMYRVLRDRTFADTKSIHSEDISFARKNIDDSCIIERNENWLQYEYDLDIIIPVYNVGKYLSGCIESVFRQTTKYKYKIIVINDGSTDNETLKILNSFSTYDNVTIINKVNGGISSARNSGMDISKGRYIMFLDSDDILFDGSIDYMLETAILNDADIVEGGYKNIAENDRVIMSYPHAKGPLSGSNDMYGYPWGKVFKRELFYNIQYAKYYFEDSIIKTIIYPIAKKKIGIAEFVYGYRRNRNSISFKSQGSSKSIDSFWINKRIYEDRKLIGLDISQEYYEYMLNIIKLTYRRTLILQEKYKIDLFYKWCELLSDFDSYSTARSTYKDLEISLKTKNFKLYKLWCSLKMFS